MSEAIKSRIRKVAALAKDSGATDPERATAQQFLDILEENYPDLVGEVFDEDVPTKATDVKWRKNYERVLAARIGKMCGVNTFTMRRANKTMKIIRFEGPTPLVNIATWMYHDMVNRLRESVKGFAFGFVEGAVPLIDNRDEETEAAAEGIKKGRTPKISALAQQSLNAGAMAGFGNRVNAPHETLPSGSPKLTGGTSG